MIQDLKKAYTDLYTVLEDNNYSLCCFSGYVNTNKNSS